jgi:hypothetical protein
LRSGVLFAGTFIVGLLIGAFVLTRTTIRTTTIYDTTTTGIPAGCRAGIADTKRLENTIKPETIPSLTVRFEKDAAGCVIPAACAAALTYFPLIAADFKDETVARAKLLALANAFAAAAKRCE